MRSVKRIAQKVTISQLGQRSVYYTGVYAILDAEKHADINTLFTVIEGEMAITAACQFFPDSSLLKNCMPGDSQDGWRVCSNWLAWWNHPAHMSNLFVFFIIGY